MKNLESDTVGLIRDLLPALDELIALLEYYDNSTYQTAVTSIAETLAQRGLVSFDDKNLYFDPERHDIHRKHPKEDCDEPYVIKTHTRGYSIDGQIIRKSIVDLVVPVEE